MKTRFDALGERRLEIARRMVLSLVEIHRGAAPTRQPRGREWLLGRCPEDPGDAEAVLDALSGAQVRGETADNLRATRVVVLRGGAAADTTA